MLANISTFFSQCVIHMGGDVIRLYGNERISRSKSDGYIFPVHFRIFRWFYSEWIVIGFLSDLNDRHIHSLPLGRIIRSGNFLGIFILLIYWEKVLTQLSNPQSNQLVSFADYTAFAITHWLWPIYFIKA